MHSVVWEIVVLLQYNRCLSELVRKKQKQHCVKGKITQFLANATGLSIELTSVHRISFFENVIFLLSHHLLFEVLILIVSTYSSSK